MGLSCSSIRSSVSMFDLFNCWIDVNKFGGNGSLSLEAAQC